MPGWGPCGAELRSDALGRADSAPWIDDGPAGLAVGPARRGVERACCGRSAVWPARSRPALRPPLRRRARHAVAIEGEVLAVNGVAAGQAHPSLVDQHGQLQRVVWASIAHQTRPCAE